MRGMRWRRRRRRTRATQCCVVASGPPRRQPPARPPTETGSDTGARANGRTMGEHESMIRPTEQLQPTSLSRGGAISVSRWMNVPHELRTGETDGRTGNDFVSGRKVGERIDGRGRSRRRERGAGRGGRRRPRRVRASDVGVASKSSVTFHSRRRPFNRTTGKVGRRSSSRPHLHLLLLFVQSSCVVVCYLNGAHPNKTASEGPDNHFAVFCQGFALATVQTEKQPPAHGSVESDAGKVHPLSVSVTVLFPPLGERATPKRERAVCMNARLLQ